VQGPEVAAFEEEFASACGTRHAVAASTGTSALHLALLAVGVGPGDEVITVSHTFIATAEAISACGASSVFIDIDPRTYLMDPSLLEAAITPRTKAIIPVHLYGQMVDMDAILAVANRHGLPVLEDACQAHRATYKGRLAGSVGTAGCFSFYPSKNLGTVGEGGAVVTNDEALAARMRMLRDHGQSRRYYHDVVGYNYRMAAIQAAALRVKLPYLDGWNAARRAHAQRYTTLLAGLPVTTPATSPHGDPVYHLYVIRASDREGLRQHLTAQGVGTGIHYPVPIHLQQAYVVEARGVALPVTELVASEVLSLPMYAELTNHHIEAVAESIAAWCAGSE
ncbi:MAG TPA: DegT/DnrJ/EryC1/StrS family aminotransferase, partial [Chloroflexota bacterium]|nr:DegT/DnrJ/EryC1/StrS family aminotransferase [Chloroflexota bacterium]